MHSIISDDAKEAPVLNVRVDIETSSTDPDNDNLKVMYEKRGGICTLVSGYSNTPIYVISMCPVGTVYSSARDLCEYTPPFSVRLHKENIIDLTRTPVQDSEGFVYKNIYCAQCHRVTSMQAWTTTLDCDDLQTLSLSDGTTRVTLIDEFSDHDMGCNRQLAPAIPSMIHECSHIDATLARLHQTRIGTASKSDVSPFPLSFSILMNFGFDGKTHILFTSAQQQPSVQCNVNEKYDPVNDKCRPIVCNSGYKLVDGTCHKIVNYDIETNPDDLATLSDTEDPLQITLTIKNITYGDMTMLQYTFSKETLAASLASMFNISTERIRDLHIEIVNDTSILNHTEDKFVEIRRFTTSPPTPNFKITEKESLVQKTLDLATEPSTGQHGYVRGISDHQRKRTNDKKAVMNDRQDTSDTDKDQHKVESTNGGKYVKVVIENIGNTLAEDGNENSLDKGNYDKNADNGVGTETDSVTTLTNKDTITFDNDDTVVETDIRSSNDIDTQTTEHETITTNEGIVVETTERELPVADNLKHDSNDKSKRFEMDSSGVVNNEVLANLLQKTLNDSGLAINDTNTEVANEAEKQEKLPTMKENSEERLFSENDGVGNDHGEGTTESPEDRWYRHLGVSVRISFVLAPAHKNQTLLEKSVKTVIQSMSDLIKSNDFMLTINGTDYKVEGVENSAGPASMDLFCQKGFHPFVDENSFDLVNKVDPKSGANVTVISVNRTGKIYYPGEYDLTFTIDGNTGNLNETHMTSFAFVCDMPAIANKQCARIVLGEKEFEIFPNRSIKFSEHYYNTSEYEYTQEGNNTVVICTPDWITSQLVYDDNQWTMACGEDLVKLVIAESYLTFILGVISLVCMLSVIITYSIFEKLRNLPGINTMNLTLSLFLGELLFIVSGWIQPHQEWLCSAFGVVLHYLFLASFFWTNVMSFDVFKTFAKKCILRRIRDKKKYMPIYSAYAWGVPLLIVSLCALFDFGDIVDGIEIGYGGASASDIEQFMNTNKTISVNADETKHVYSIGCWIQEPVASMAVFGGPMIVILLSNTVMFARTIICIRASTRATKSSVRKSSLNHMTGKDDVMLYIRMSTVMGFTWVFGLASSVVSAFAAPPSRTTCIILHLLGMLFIVFNCSQGIFIFFAFVFNRRVLGLYRGLFSKLKRKKGQPSSLSTSRGTLTSNISETNVSHIT